MAEYIDREALIQELDAKLCALHGELDENRIVYDAFTDGFEECVGEVGKFQFAADVATVVRCRDCKYWGDEHGTAQRADGALYARCRLHNHDIGDRHIGWVPTENDFCSYGERRNYD